MIKPRGEPCPRRPQTPDHRADVGAEDHVRNESVRVMGSTVRYGNEIRLRDEPRDGRDLIVGLLHNAIVELVTQVNQPRGFLWLAKVPATVRREIDRREKLRRRRALHVERDEPLFTAAAVVNRSTENEC